MPTTSPQKETAASFLTLIVADKIRPAFEAHAAPDFRHHHPFCKGDRESLIIAMEENGALFPNKIFRIRRMIEEGDTVAVHSHMKLNAEGPKFAMLHILRFANGKIVELWDMGQQIPADSPNENGIF